MPVLHAPHLPHVPQVPRVRRCAGLLLLAAALYAAPAPPAYGAAADDPGWTAEPAAGQAVPRTGDRPSTARPFFTRPFFYMAGTAGTVLEDRLALANTTDQEHTVTLRGADAYNTADGAFAVRPAAGSTGAGAWISFGAGTTVRIPPHTRAVVPFTVTVPPSSPPGDHPAAVVATEAGREVGVRVHLRVGGPALAALTVEDVAVRGRGAAAVVAYTLVNRGNVALAPDLSLRAEGRFGEVPGLGARALPVELLPGQRVELTEPWPGAPVLDQVRVTVTVTAPGGARAEGSASAWFLPWRAAGWTGLGLLALGAAPAALFLVRSRRTRREPPGGERPGETPGRPDPTPAPEHELTGASR
ncbi:hypothetical protein [Streptomyces sp. NPDC048357]|uniref:COG1470 family protein n=1 Tax=Streptomyces sp. NPDC048357 TaxID=3154719 RepID=UPI00342CDBE4